MAEVGGVISIRRLGARVQTNHSAVDSVHVVISVESRLELFGHSVCEPSDDRLGLSLWSSHLRYSVSVSCGLYRTPPLPSLLISSLSLPLSRVPRALRLMHILRKPQCAATNVPGRPREFWHIARLLDLLHSAAFPRPPRRHGAF